ncbi:MAG: hypothetical protein CM15mP44_5160 [Candidatus Neomarinimicrobiota bacterium]|nr:MAG: hypothetical protein CM15mP44_5160 [Candidatus Neomarinimicrobiota bacterium]
MYKAYPVIKYNRFLNNGSTSQKLSRENEDPVTKWWSNESLQCRRS